MSRCLANEPVAIQIQNGIENPLSGVSYMMPRKTIIIISALFGPSRNLAIFAIAGYSKELAIFSKLQQELNRFTLKFHII